MEPLFKVVIFTVLSTMNSLSTPRQNNSYKKYKQKQTKTPKLLDYLCDKGTNKMILFIGRVWKTKGEKWTKQWTEELEP